MTICSWRSALAVALALTLPAAAAAQDTNGNPAPHRTLLVATKEAPPFAFKTPDGEWEGLSIKLWEHLAAELRLEFEYVELPLPEILDRVERGEVDAAVAALTVTADRELRMDFSYPYYDGGLGIAVTARRESVLFGVLKRLFSWQFLSAVAGLATVLAVAAVFVWIFERRANAEQFGGSRLRGLGAGFWWSAVTMTTVGYGDKAPRTLGGRIVALVWMFASIIIISSFTAGIASSLTASHVAADQLRNRPVESLVVAAVAQSTGEEFAERYGVRAQSYPTVQGALEAVDRGKAQAIIYDLPVLRHYLLQDPNRNVEVLPRILVPESYAIALPPESPMRETLNRALLTTLRTPEWQDLRVRYLGSSQ